MYESVTSFDVTQLAAMVEGFIQTEAGKAIVGKMVN